MEKVIQLPNESWLVYWTPTIDTERPCDRRACFRIANREFTIFLQTDCLNDVFQLDISVSDTGKNFWILDVKAPSQRCTKKVSQYMITKKNL
jgi:hypothetical protein